MASAADASFGDFGKQLFHQVQPTAIGRGEVNVIARVARQPRSHHGDLVGSVVVRCQVDVKAVGKIRVDVVEKPQELLMPMRAAATAETSTPLLPAPLLSTCISLAVAV